MLQERAALGFLFIGNYGCLDFVNTVYMYNGEQVDMLQDFSDFIDWLKEAGLIDSGQMNKALQEWGNTPLGELALEKAREFRTVMRTLAERSVAAEPIPLSVTVEINLYLHMGGVYSQLLKTQDGNYMLQTCRELSDPLQLLVPIAESAAGLLATESLSHVKKCGNPNCILYFYDNSKNRSRRWCSMESCGNRIKAAAHYRRNRGNHTLE